MASNETLVNALNAIRDSASPSYAERVPAATIANLADVGNPILQYSSVMNEFLSLLVNRIGMVLVHNKELKNPLSILKQGESIFGDTVEETGVNPAKAQTYNPTSTDLLAQAPPDVKAAYHRLNRKDRYTVTINRSQIKLAFTSWAEFEKLINSIVNSLYSGNYLDEFLMSKRLFGSAVEENKIKIETVNALTSEAAAKDFIIKARTAFTNFQLPSSNYNSWAAIGGTGEPFITLTEKQDIRFIIRSDIEAFVDVNVLASAFNIDKSTLLGQMLVVDNFDTAENCLAIMCDKSFPQIWDNLTEVTEFNNGSNLTINYYLHKWQTYSISPLANALAFCTAVESAS